MPVCLSHYSALELYWACSRSQPDFDSWKRTGKLETCSVVHALGIIEEAGLAPLLSMPIHLAMPRNRRGHYSPKIKQHVLPCPLPSNALLKAGDDVYVASPELIVATLGKWASEIEVALLAYELCGTYALHPRLSVSVDSDQMKTPANHPGGRYGGLDCGDGKNLRVGDGAGAEGRFRAEERAGSRKGAMLKGGSDLRDFIGADGAIGADGVIEAGGADMVVRDYSLTSSRKIKRLVGELGPVHGVKTARSVLSYLLDGSASPMETAMALMLTAPTRLGGMGLSGAVLNKEVRTIDGRKRIDLMWPRYKLGLEYQGVAFHEGWETRVRDDRRRNAISAKGMQIMPVYFQDLASPALFDKLVQKIARAAGLRIRIRRQDFRLRQMVLRSRALPPVGSRWL